MTLLQFHVAISLIAIAAGLVVIFGLVSGRASTGWTTLFLVTTIVTSATGFPLPPFGLDPARIVGTISLVLLAAAMLAYFGFRLVGPWRWIYICSATAALYLNVFVAVAQAFGKLPALQALAPTQSEPPFVIAQLLTLVIFIALGARAVVSFK
jgi:hypothetical protein